MAHMTVNKKETAHQLWCDRIEAELNKIIHPNRRKAEEARKAVVNFLSLHLRIHVDEMILRLDEAKKLHDATQSIKTKFYQRDKIRHKKMMLAEQKATLDAYQAAVLILVNTKPPSKAASDGK